MDQRFKSLFLRQEPTLLNESKLDVDNFFTLNSLEKILQNPAALEHSAFERVAERRDRGQAARFFGVRALRHFKEGNAQDALPNQFRSLERILEALKNNASIKVNRIHLFDSKLEILRNQIYQEIGCPCYINCYLTPPRAQCFYPHFDDHDVFIIQVDGQKSWTVDSIAKEDYPLKGKSFGSNSFQYSNPLRLTLKKGDILFIPTGHVHHAQTSKEFSLHLTVAICQMRRIDLVNELLDLKLREKNSLLNKAIPRIKTNRSDSDANFISFVKEAFHAPDSLISQAEQEWRRRKMDESCRFTEDQQIAGLMRLMSYDSKICTNILIKGSGHVKIEFRDESILLVNKYAHVPVSLRHWECLSKIFGSPDWFHLQSFFDSGYSVELNHVLQDLISQGFVKCKINSN